MIHGLASLGYIIGTMAGGDTRHGMELNSPAFRNETVIPRQYTCQGHNQFVPLRWKNAPYDTRSFVLIVEDPDAPGTAMWYHLGLYNIAPTVHHLPMTTTETEVAKLNARYALNSWGRRQYRGPCPPLGQHRYVFRLYALNTTLHFNEKEVTIEQLEDAMIGHILDTAQLVGTYSKS